MLKRCALCPRTCSVDRLSGEYGFCRAPAGAVVARAALHAYEEPCISGTRGSGAVFFSGCTMRCVYCQNHTIAHCIRGKHLNAHALADVFRSLEAQGAHNLNLVSATPYVPLILEALSLYSPEIPVVYNSGGYERPETIQMLAGAVDIFLPDFKYSDNATAKRLSGIDDYVETAIECIREMKKLASKNLETHGIMKKGVLVRHLVLPGEVKNSLGVLRLLLKHFGKDTAISLMSQFTPQGNRLPEHLRRKLKPLEYKIVLREAEKLGFANGYVQELSSADEWFIPAFYPEEDWPY